MVSISGFVWFARCLWFVSFVGARRIECSREQLPCTPSNLCFSLGCGTEEYPNCLSRNLINWIRIILWFLEFVPRGDSPCPPSIVNQRSHRNNNIFQGVPVPKNTRIVCNRVHFIEFPTFFHFPIDAGQTIIYIPGITSTESEQHGEKYRVPVYQFLYVWVLLPECQAVPIHAKCSGIILSILSAKECGSRKRKGLTTRQ